MIKHNALSLKRSGSYGSNKRVFLSQYGTYFFK